MAVRGIGKSMISLTTLPATLPAIAFPTIDPILVKLGPLTIHWYALSYVGGVLLGWWYLHKLNALKPPAFTPKALDDVMVWAIFGIILGGRLGYVLFYNADYYLSNPMQILHVWQGGMAFHGGLLGVILAIYLLCRYHKLQFWPVIDLMACVTPIGLGLGRIANFINAELYGRVTDVPWGIIFPGQTEPRHPSQLYQAVLEGLVLLGVMSFLVYCTSARLRPGFLSGCFLIGYATFRSISELFREPDAHLGFIIGSFTMGQLLSVPMFLFGGFLILRAMSLPKRQGGAL